MNSRIFCAFLVRTRSLRRIVFFLLLPIVAMAEHRLQMETGLESGNLLIADKDMQDPVFGQSVILIIKYDENGAYGIILNRMSRIPASEILPHANWSGEPPHVFLGGPVAMNSVRILIHSEESLPAGTSISEHVWMIDSAPGLISYSEELAGNLTSSVFLGYAGWSPGQLEAEIRRGDWDIWPGNAELIFSEEPENLWFDIHQQMQRIWAGRDHLQRSMRYTPVQPYRVIGLRNTCPVSTNYSCKQVSLTGHGKDKMPAWM